MVVDTDSICAAIKDVFQDTRSVLEPAGAMAVAGAKQYAAEHKLKDKTLVAIACGANMNFDRLRFVAERAEGRTVYYRAAPQGLEPLVTWMDHYGVFWRERFQNLRDLLKEIDP